MKWDPGLHVVTSKWSLSLSLFVSIHTLMLGLVAYNSSLSGIQLWAFVQVSYDYGFAHQTQTIYLILLCSQEKRPSCNNSEIIAIIFTVCH